MSTAPDLPTGPARDRGTGDRVAPPAAPALGGVQAGLDAALAAVRAAAEVPVWTLGAAATVQALQTLAGLRAAALLVEGRLAGQVEDLGLPAAAGVPDLRRWLVRRLGRTDRDARD